MSKELVQSLTEELSRWCCSQAQVSRTRRPGVVVRAKRESDQGRWIAVNVFVYADGATEYLCLLGLDRSVTQVHGVFPAVAVFVAMLEAAWTSTDNESATRVIREKRTETQLQRPKRWPPRCTVCRGRGGSSILGQWMVCQACVPDLVVQPQPESDPAEPVRSNPQL